MRGIPVGSLHTRMHLERLGCLYLHAAAAVAASAFGGGDLFYRLREAQVM